MWAWRPAGKQVADPQTRQRGRGHRESGNCPEEGVATSEGPLLSGLQTGVWTGAQQMLVRDEGRGQQGRRELPTFCSRFQKGRKA